MPLLASDAGSAFSLRIWPFGVHGGDAQKGGHLYDGGHPGWDIEYKAGASVRAPADGTIQSVLSDSHTSGRTTIQIQHGTGSKNYRTNYTNIQSPAVTVGGTIKAGDPLGLAGSAEGYVGPTKVTYYMTHFQLDDFTTPAPNDGRSNPHSVNPEPYLTPDAKILFDSIWAVTAYQQELTEPFTGHPRDKLNPFPIKRTWTLQSQPTGANFPSRIEFIYVDPAVDVTPSDYHDYNLYDSGGNVIESGSIQLNPRGTPHTTIDFTPSSGSKRLGVYDILNESLKIDWALSPLSRPINLSNAATYKTQKP